MSLVSVIIPTFKRAEYIERAVLSVLNQTYRDIEILVVDNNADSSSDRTQTTEKLKQFENDKRVRLLYSPVYENGSSARNYGFSNSKGEYICFLDDDDIFHTEKLQIQIDFLNQNADFEAVCCEHRSLFRKTVYRISHITEQENGNYLSDLLSGKTVLASGSTLMIRRDVVNELHGFDENFKRHQDLEFMTRFFRKHRLGIIHKPLVDIHVDGRRNYPQAKDFYEIKQQFNNQFKTDLEQLPQSERMTIFDRQHQEVALYYMLEDNKAMAKHHISQIKGKAHNELLFRASLFAMQLDAKLPIIAPLKYYLASLPYKLKLR